MTQPTPSTADQQPTWDDCATVANALTAAPGTGEIWRDPAGDIVGEPMSLARIAVEALLAAGRLTTNGRCGTVLPGLDSHSDPHRPVCALPAGHTGWHRADNGCEWGEPQDDQNPPAPHVTEWLKQAVANHTPGQPDDIDRLYARATRLAAPTTEEPQP